MNDAQKNVKLRQVYIQNSKESCEATVLERQNADADRELIYAHDIWQLEKYTLVLVTSSS